MREKFCLDDGWRFNLGDQTLNPLSGHQETNIDIAMVVTSILLRDFLPPTNPPQSHIRFVH